MNSLKWEINVCGAWRENCKQFPADYEDKLRDCDPAKPAGPNKKKEKS